MPKRSFAERVELLEQKVEELHALPARVGAVESQISQLRTEMGDGFSAIVHRLDGHDARLDGIDARLDRVGARLDAVQARLDAHDARFDAHDARFDLLERRMLESDEDTRRQMRVLHEEVLARISLVQEGRGRRKR